MYLIALTHHSAQQVSTQQVVATCLITALHTKFTEKTCSWRFVSWAMTMEEEHTQLKEMGAWLRINLKVFSLPVK